jgi:glutathione synthase/RimK-type ligase-like ATP-grasp enzyme
LNEDEMSRIAILTPDPGDEGYRTRWAQVLERNAEPLRRAGLEISGQSWTEDHGLEDYDLVLPLLVWGYPRAHSEWVRRVDGWQARGVRLGNEASVLRWNSDTIYLGALAERGAPVVPTLYFEQLTAEAMGEAAKAFGAERLVAKPRISSTAWQTVRWSPGMSLEEGPEGAAMVQPYLERIERSGEVSLIYFGGIFSHAIQKVPQPGDFRVQPEYGGIITRYEPAPEELEAAERVLGAVEERLLYARVDLLRGSGGDPQLIELELIEPDLYLAYAPAEGAAFAAAVKELIGG